MDLRQLTALRTLRENWTAQFDLNVTNSVAAQLSNFTWDLTRFEVFQEVLRLTPDAKDEEGGKQLNGLLFRLFTRTCLDCFMSSIRKISDTTGNTSSLVKLLENIRTNSDKLTRELMLESEGIPYDWEKLEAKEHAALMEEFAKGAKAVHSAYYGSASHSRHRHDQIDKLCQVTERYRKPTDRVPKQLFSDLITRIEQSCNRVKEHVNQFIAHAAPVGSIKPVTPIYLRDLYAAHQTLCEVAGFVSLHILGANQYSFYVHPLGDPFIYLERPLCPKDHRPTLTEKLEQLEKQFGAYSEWHPHQRDHQS